jgi:hypothetical protein
MTDDDGPRRWREAVAAHNRAKRDRRGRRTATHTPAPDPSSTSRHPPHPSATSDPSGREKQRWADVRHIGAGRNRGGHFFPQDQPGHPRTSVFPHSIGGGGILAPVATSRRKRLPVNASLTKRVQTTVNALEITAADEALVGLAYEIAATIDGMDDDTRQRMLGQTASQLTNVLAALRKQAAPRPWSKWDEIRPHALAASRR